MKYRILGKTGLKVSVISLGTHQFSGEWAKTFSAQEVQTILGRASELGINVIDTAECYGDHSVECIIGASIASNRDKWILATKFGHAYAGKEKIGAWSAAQVQQQLEDSLRALQTDCIDLYQFHSGNNQEFENEELWAMLNAQVRAGKIRFLGISLSAAALNNNDLRQLEAAGKVGASVVQVVYNRLQKKAEERVLPFCDSHQLGVLARVPLAKGFLSGNYKPGTVFPKNDMRSDYSQSFNDEQLRLAEEIKRNEVPPGQNMAQWALAWCLKQQTVASVIVGCKSVAQLESNAAACQ
ncbi:MAG TPA: aldo/keto reductase [Verrucomicrobiae bacterium]|jgi:aryl-alcohol dehydrogenase-like predicted oxidoreductase|nr:aldo/keto reductase [Verrucomicrobiae bacterium]